MQLGATRQRIIDATKKVLHDRGTGHTTLAEIAKVASITRVAIYWHFKNKAELFLAVRRDFLAPVMNSIEHMLSSESHEDPLDAIELSVRAFFHFLEEHPIVLQLYQNMMLRCEYADEFSRVQSEINSAILDCLGRIEQAYKRAKTKGTLPSHMHPSEVAWDTLAFSNGLLHLAVAWPASHGSGKNIMDMISSHMVLRRLH